MPKTNRQRAARRRNRAVSRALSTPRRGVRGRRARVVTVVRPPIAVRTNRRRTRRRGGLLASIGGAAGSLISPAVSRLGRSLGGGLASIMGRGDYVVSNPVTSNSLAGTTPPMFGDATGVARVRHREYVMDVSGSTAFSSLSFQLQPGLPQLFPWLARIAQNYEQYRLMGICIEFKSTSSNALNSLNTALGVVGLVTQYDAHEAPFQSKQEAENYVGCQTANPSQSILHYVECAAGQNPLDKLYVRTNALNEGADVKFYDYGIINLFTVGMQQAAVIGELWVSYDIEFSKPKMPPGITYAIGSDTYELTQVDMTNTAYTAGLTRYPEYGSLGTSLVNGRIYFPKELPSGEYQIMWHAYVSGTNLNGPPSWGAVNPVFGGTGISGVARWVTATSGTDSVQVSSGINTNNTHFYCLVAISLAPIRNSDGWVDCAFNAITNSPVAAITGAIDITVHPATNVPPTSSSKGLNGYKELMLKYEELAIAFREFKLLQQNPRNTLEIVHEEDMLE